MSGFSSYQIARSGLFASESALNTTGHNISNVNTAGFSRQQVMVASTRPDTSTKFPVGLGATIEEVRQIRDSFVDNVFWTENQDLGYDEARLKTINDVESVLGEPMTDGLQSVMNDFWDSWNELSKNPESLTVRTLVRQRASDLVNQFNHIGDQLNKLQDDLNSEISVTVSQVNSLASNIANLNLEILKAENSGDRANDLRDQRANYIDNLSKLVNINVNEKQDGTVDVDISGRFLVTRGEACEIYAGENQLGSLFNAPKWKDGDQLVDITNGTLKGLLEARGEAVVGTVGSVTNGSPSTKADITLAIDLSDDSMGAANLSYIKSHISDFVNRLNNKGIDYQFNLITYGGASGADAPVTFSGATAGADLEAAVAGLTTRSTSTDNNFTSVVDELKNDVTYRNDTNKYLMVLTNESVEGDEVAFNAAQLQTQIDDLNKLGMKTSIVTKASYIGDANPEPGWQTIADQTDGKMYDLATADFDTMGVDVDTDVGRAMSTIQASNDVIPDIKKRLNALINIMAREINSLEKSGKDNNGSAGIDFFVKDDPNFSLQMGNIKVNPAFTDLNKIAAAKTTSQGDNSLVQDIISLRNSDFFGDASVSQNGDDYYRSVILAIGNSGSEAQKVYDGQSKLVESAKNQRSAISGVSMDEEMSNMMKYQYSYNAAARVISLVDECFDNIINKLGASK